MDSRREERPQRPTGGDGRRAVLAGADPAESGGRPDSAPKGLPYADWPLPRTVLGLFAGLLIGGVLLPAPVALLDPGIDTYGGLIAVQTLLSLAFLGTAILVADHPTDLFATFSRLGLRRFSVGAVGLVLATFAAYLAFLAAYASLVGSPEQQDLARELGLDAGPALAIVSVALIAMLAPLCEELFFRGMFFGGLRASLPFLPAALLSGAVFGSLHLTTGVSTVPPLIVFGFLLAWTYEHTRSLWPAVILHALNNSLALAVA